MRDLGSLPRDYAAEPEMRRRMLGAGRLAALVAIALLPWIGLLGATLPQTFTARNWPLAWMGLDGAIALAAGLTALLLRRGDPRAALSATATATLLIVDSWFDTVTSAPGLDHGVAMAQAVLIELPLAAGALWLAASVLRHALR